MPVTVHVNENIPERWTSGKAASDEELLKSACTVEYGKCEKILQSSFSRSMLRKNHISPSINGFVYSMIHAYSNHHTVSIRPEDVWFAILSQLSFYINAHAEELRSFFVAHEGRKQLEVVEIGALENVDMSKMTERMTELIQNNIVDPELREWIMPTFSTTTDSDRVVASILMMGSLQAYFEYRFSICCGMPSVTLLGERDDWNKILERVDKMAQLGDEPTRFVALLKPVLRRFIASFDDPVAPDLISFWARAVNRYSGSGMDFCCGWVAAFCMWDVEGKYIGRESYPDCYELDGIQYHMADIKKVPSGSVAVPLTIDDNGNIFPARMVAGSVGIKANFAAEAPAVSSSPTPNSSNCGNGVGQPGSAIEPVTGWWTFASK
ncbi:hypothetical protein CMQ_3552 [Grosmannia clavigera kw1407]|uniref:Uncharacterized protein n=1 Tax=Grosmannia clavigera (strain kw1407 / UAMH 11150) TaxID=655863 RepID=F0XAP6_GROCL|nr:uncharacterized protein CMQ_3552 [Grosmannia clavigera kw1407]EFX05483.1 hypothetical protein CMQ_3552 [Grosmannia clavigera kw1407]